MASYYYDEKLSGLVCHDCKRVMITDMELGDLDPEPRDFVVLTKMRQHDRDHCTTSKGRIPGEDDKKHTGDTGAVAGP